MRPDPLDASTAWYLVALALPLGLGIAVAAALLVELVRGRRWTSRVSLLGILACAAAAMLALAFASGWDGSPVSWVSVDGNVVQDAVKDQVLGRAPLAAGLLAGATAGFIALRSRGRLLPLLASLGVAGASISSLVVADALDLAPRRDTDPLHTILRDVDVEVVASNLSGVTSLTEESAGSLLASDLTGSVFRIPAAGGPLEVVANLRLEDDARLFRVEPHPDWPATPVLLAAFEYPAGDSYLGRFAALTIHDADRAPTVQVILDGFVTRPDHPGSGIAVCGDWVYFSVGDGDDLEPTRPGSPRLAAQRLDSVQGKILRFRLGDDGIQPVNAADAPPVSALGLRNPFDIVCGEDDESLLAVENGSKGHDQIRVITAGSNHEWPLSEARDLLTPPLYDSTNTSIAPTGIARVSEPGQTRIYFVTFHSEALYELVISDSGSVGPLTRLHKFDQAALSVTTASDGCVYVGGVATIWRVMVVGCEAR